MAFSDEVFSLDCEKKIEKFFACECVKKVFTISNGIFFKRREVFIVFTKKKKIQFEFYAFIQNSY